MRFAINLPNFGEFGYPHRLAELAQEAEAAGWDGFFIWDHVQYFVPGERVPLEVVRNRIRQGPPRLP